MTLPTIPDNLHKLFLLIGLILLGFSYYETTNDFKKYELQYDNYISASDSLQILSLKIDKKIEKLKRIADAVSSRNHVENPIKEKDSVLYFDRVISGTINQLAVSDTLQNLWEDYKDFKFDFKIYEKVIEFKNTALQQSRKEMKSNETANDTLLILGMIFAFIGYFGIGQNQKIQDDLLKRQLSEKEKYYPFCQSCGKKFSSIRLPGTKNDGSLNKAYCYECYQSGDFTNPNLTLNEVLVISKTGKNRRPTKLGRWFLKMRLKGLERWDTDEYF